MSKQRYIMAHAEARRRAMAAVSMAPEGYVVTVAEPIKSRAQEEKYHAQIGEIAEVSRFQGRRLSDDTMKRLLLDQFKAETRDDSELKRHWDAMAEIEMMPSLDGRRIIVLGTQSRYFPKPLAASFITWLDAWAAENCPELQESTA